MKNFFAFLVFIVAFGGWYVYHSTKETRDALAEGSEQMAGQEKLVTIRETEFNAIVQALKLREQVAAKQKQLAGLHAQQNAIGKQIAALQLQKKKQVTVNRQVMIGTVLTNLTLNDGRKFPEAKISKIDDVSVSFTVPSGVLKVKPSELSAEVRQMLQYP